MRPILYILIAILLVLVIAIGGLAVLLANPDLYRQQLSETFKAETGLTLNINGDISWRYWPLIALNINDLEILPAGTGEPVAEFESAAVDLALLPLLFGGSDITIDGIFIDRLNINLRIDEKGDANWQPMKGTTAEAEALADTNTDGQTAPDTPTESEDSTFGLDISVIEIRDARIEYQDIPAGQHYLVEISSLTTGSVLYDEPVDIDASAAVEDKVAGIGARTEISGQLTFNDGFSRFVLTNMELDNTVESPDLPALRVNTKLTGKFDTEEDTAAIDEGTLTLGEFSTDFSISVNDLSGKPHFGGAITTSSFNPRALLTQLDIAVPEMAAETALSSLELSANFAGELSRIQLENIFARFDGSLLKGNVTVAMADKTGVDLALDLDRINVGDYLPPESRAENSGESASPSNQQAPEDVEVIPLELLDQYDVTANFVVGELGYGDYMLTGAKMNLTNRNRKLDAAISALGYEGSLDIVANASTASSASGKLKVTVNRLNITRLTEWEWITGTFNATSQTSFTGNMLSEILDSIDGPTRFEITDGTLNVTPIKSLAAAVDAIRGKTSSVSEWPDIMPFEQLRGEHELNEGIEANQKFAFTLENLNVTGTGGVDYWQNHLAYDIEVALEQTESGRFQVNPQLAGIRWPLHCEGALDDSPVDSCLPDSKGVRNMVAEVAKQELKRKRDEKVEEKKEELQEKAKDLLKGLFNR